MFIICRGAYQLRGDDHVIAVAESSADEFSGTTVAAEVGSIEEIDAPLKGVRVREQIVYR